MSSTTDEYIDNSVSIAQTITVSEEQLEAVLVNKGKKFVRDEMFRKTKMFVDENAFDLDKPFGRAICRKGMGLKTSAANTRTLWNRHKLTQVFRATFMQKRNNVINKIREKFYKGKVWVSTTAVTVTIHLTHAVPACYADFPKPADDATDSIHDAYASRIRRWFWNVILLRKGASEALGGSDCYQKFLFNYGPRFSPAMKWKLGADEPAKIATVADEAFALLVLENITHPWVSGNRGMGHKYSLPCRKATGSEAWGGGWTKEGLIRYSEITKYVSADRLSDHGKAFEKKFRDGFEAPLASRGKRQKKGIHEDLELRDSSGTVVDLRSLCGVSAEDEEDSVVGEEENQAEETGTDGGRRDETAESTSPPGLQLEGVTDQSEV